ncbi:MAG: sugar phosphate isomerase/epimerase [Desulfobacteraceae bacterium]|nr:sugar phosphate isomerase/epimerase [Desulfobacteraceae bacterium]
MMPKVSLSTWCFFPRLSIQRSIQFGVDHGFEGIEIWCNAIDFWPRTVTAKEIESIKSLARANGLQLAVHFCTVNNNLADMNPGHLNESMNQLKETIRMCRRIGARLVVIHPGRYSDIFPYCDQINHTKFTPEVLKQAAIERFKTSLKEAALFAESHDVVIGLENYSSKSHCLLTCAEDIAEWVDGINSPALKVTLDIGNANMEGSIKKVINVLGDRIGHVHLHDNKGDELLHGELGSGGIDWTSLRTFLKSFPGMLCLEVAHRSDAEGAVLRSKAFLDKLLARS